MAFEAETFYRASYKILRGVAHTANSKDPPNEALASQVLVAANQIIGELINSDPDVAKDINVEYVEADLSEDVTSNGKAYIAKFPATYSGFFGTGAQGDSISDFAVSVPKWVNSSLAESDHSGGYAPELLDNGVHVPFGSTEDWDYDPFASIVTSEDNLNLSTTGTIGIYLYTGNLVSDNAKKSNFAATTDPTVNDDSGDGYEIGSFWINTSTPAAFICIDPGVGAADWNQIDGAGGGGAPVDGEYLVYDLNSTLNNEKKLFAGVGLTDNQGPTSYTLDVEFGDDESLEFGNAADVSIGFDTATNTFVVFGKRLWANSGIRVPTSQIVYLGTTSQTLLQYDSGANQLDILTADSAVTPSMRLKTGNASAGAAGDIELEAGTGTTTDGVILLNSESRVVDEALFLTNSTNEFAFKAAATGTYSYEIEFPNADPAANQVLEVSAFSGGTATTQWIDTPAGGGAPTDASYVVIALDGTLTDERRLQAGSGITLSDGDAGGDADLVVGLTKTITLNSDIDLLFGTTNQHAIRFDANASGNDALAVGLKGAAPETPMLLVMKLEDLGVATRAPALVTNPTLRIYSDDETDATEYVELFHDSTDAVITSGKGELRCNQYLRLHTDSGDANYVGLGVASAPTSYDISFPTSTPGDATFLQHVSGGTYAWSAAAGGGAPTGASYVVMALDGTLTDERRLQAGSGITLSDGDAGGDADLVVGLTKTITLNSDIDLLFGTTNQHAIRFDANASGNDALAIGLRGGTPTTPMLLLMKLEDLGSANRAPSLVTNPTLRIYGDDNADATEYVDLYHDGSNAMITAGKGELRCNQYLRLHRNAGESQYIGLGVASTPTTYDISFPTSTPGDGTYLQHVSAGAYAWDSGTGGAPADAEYVTWDSNATLSDEKVLTAGDGISIPALSATVAANQSFAFDWQAKHDFDAGLKFADTGHIEWSTSSTGHLRLYLPAENTADESGVFAIMRSDDQGTRTVADADTSGSPNAVIVRIYAAGTGADEYIQLYHTGSSDLGVVQVGADTGYKTLLCRCEKIKMESDTRLTALAPSTTAGQDYTIYLPNEDEPTVGHGLKVQAVNGVTHTVTTEWGSVAGDIDTTAALTWTGLQTFDAGIRLNDSDVATFGTTLTGSIKYDSATNRLQLQGSALGTGFEMRTLDGVGVDTGDIVLTAGDGFATSDGGSVILTAGAGTGGQNDGSVIVTLNSGVGDGRFKVLGNLSDIGGGTYTVADGDNDLGVAGDFEVLGNTSLDDADVRAGAELTFRGGGMALGYNGTQYYIDSKTNQLIIQSGLQMQIKTSDATTPANMTLVGGTASGGAGGSIELNGGDGSTNFDGGDIVLCPGDGSGSGTDGLVVLCGKTVVKSGIGGTARGQITADDTVGAEAMVIEPVGSAEVHIKSGLLNIGAGSTWNKVDGANDVGIVGDLEVIGDVRIRGRLHAEDDIPIAFGDTTEASFYWDSSESSVYLNVGGVDGSDIQFFSEKSMRFNNPTNGTLIDWGANNQLLLGSASGGTDHAMVIFTDDIMYMGATANNKSINWATSNEVKIVVNSTEGFIIKNTAVTPVTDDTQTMGTGSLQWADVYCAGDIYCVPGTSADTVMPLVRYNPQQDKLEVMTTSGVSGTFQDRGNNTVTVTNGIITALT